MASIDISRVTKAAGEGASVPLLSRLIRSLGISAEDSNAAAQQIITGEDPAEVIAPLPLQYPAPSVFTPMNLALGGIAIIGIVLFMRKS